MKHKKNGFATLLSKLLIIGGSGLVGSTLLQYSLSHYNVHVTVNQNQINFNRNSVSKIDLLQDRVAITNLIEKLKPDVVINTAALPSVDLCETNPKLADMLHVDVTNDICMACKKTESKLIHFSTDAVFDGKLTRKYTEEDKPNPINHYGKTRLIAENIVLDISDDNVILRTAVIYGWHAHSRFTNWILEYLRNNKPVDPFVDQFNTPTLVDDLAKAILKIIDMDISGLFHATGKTCISRYDFAIMLADKFGYDKNLIKPVTSNEKKQDAPRPPKTCLDATKLENLIGYHFSDINSGISFIYNKSKFQ